MADESTTDQPAEEPRPTFPAEAAPPPEYDPSTVNLADIERQGGDGG